MCCIECYFRNLKGFVKNKARVKGNMVEGYALKEVLGFCTKYLQDFTITRW
jgi:hypothetical protein